MKTELISEIHTAHREWLNKIAFYRDEVKFMQHRIEEIASNNTGQEVLVQVEHFQNQLIIQTSTLDQFSHDINKHEKAITDMILANPVASDHRRAEPVAGMADSVQTFERIFNDLRHELIHFLAKVM
jgi:hypothetical protein